MTDDPIESFIEVSIQTVLALIFVGVMLFFNRILYAYVQVMTAIMFCANIVAVCIVPVLIWLTVTEEPLSYYLLMLLLLWDYAIVTYISKQALSINLFASLIVALSYFIATYLTAIGLGQLI
ncbi:MAG: hypothetical protein ACXWF8_09000 [Methylobacter sp.]